MNREHYLEYLPPNMHAEFLKWPESSARELMNRVDAQKQQQAELSALRRRQQIAAINGAPLTAMAVGLAAEGVERVVFVNEWGCA